MTDVRKSLFDGRVPKIALALLIGLEFIALAVASYVVLATLIPDWRF